MSYSIVESSDCITLNLGEKLSFRLYRDCKPNCLETASLQKGLVLVLSGEELIEEGVGFGVPAVKYRDKTYFSSTAHISVQKQGDFYCLKKSYVLDTVSRKRFWKAIINDGFYSFIRKIFEKIYLRNKNLSPVNNKIMELRNSMKIKTEFQKVTPRGIITTEYLFQPDGVKITVDFYGLELDGCLEILMLNEQGANNFPFYSDSNGSKLSSIRIGAWDLVKAKEASLTNTNKTLAFTLQNGKSARLFRGWEMTKNRFSWAGLSYSMPPGRRNFDYTVKISFHEKL
jgi:hypothetical protein